MSLPLPTFAVTLKKTSARPPSAELSLVRLGGAEDMDLWPDLAAQLLAEPEGSPLRDHPDPASLIGEVTLLKRRGAEATWQVGLRDESLVKRLPKGLTWQSAVAAPPRPPRLLAGAWAADGKAVLLAFDNGLARLVGVTKKGLGSDKALLNHPGLLAVACGSHALLTAGGSSVRLWDAAGKKVEATHTTPALVTAACFWQDRAVVGLSDGSVRVIGGEDLSPPGGVAVSAMTSRGERLAAGLADGRVLQWDPAVTEVRAAGAAPITALRYAEDGRLLMGDASGQVYSSAGESWLFPPDSGLGFYNVVISPGGQEVLVSDRGRVCAVSLEDGRVTELAELGNVYHLQYSPSGRIRVAVGNNPHSLSLWDREGRLLRAATGVSVGPLRAHSQNPDVAAFSPSERYVALQQKESNYKDGSVVVLDLESGGSVALPNHNADYAWVEGMAWLDEDRLLVSYANEKDKLWTVSSRSARVVDEGAQTSQLARTSRGVAVCTPQAFSEPGRVRTLRFEDMATVAAFPLDGLFESSYPPSMQVSGDGRVVLLLNFHQPVCVLTEGGTPWQVPDSTGMNTALLAPSGRWALLHSRDRQLQIWDVRARRLRATVPLDYARLAFTADEAAVLCVGGTKITRMSLDGEVSPVLDGADLARPPGPILALDALPGGEVLACVQSRQARFRASGGNTTRYDGRTILSADGGLALVMSTYGALVTETRMF